MSYLIKRGIVDKTTWPDGPWNNEPDTKHWTDEATGYPCAVVRHPRYGSLCGYVGLPEGHPLYGLDYGAESDKLTEALERRKQEPVGENPSFMVLVSCITGVLKPAPDIVFKVHGGLTFSDKSPDEDAPKDHWFFGFDCGHAWDYQPGLDSELAKYGVPRLTLIKDTVYRDFAYVEAECASLAQQLALFEEPKADRMIIIEA